ncbi:MAG TPA: amidohydrolase family protein [Candidatus Angelobacter sp.]|nr:amidohydrolase family protein [Candidatus Angelobacter sp.]
MKIFFVLFFGLTMTTIAAAKNQKQADIIFINGDIYTGTAMCASSTSMPHTCPTASFPGHESSFPESVKVPHVHVQALAVSDGRIIYAGSNELALKFKGKKTRIIDLGGNFVMPGFNDAHVHLFSAGSEKLNVDLVGSKSLDEMKQRIAARGKATAPGEWIKGEGWDHTLWASQTTPTRQDIDSVTGDHPAIFTRVDGHIAVANTAALKAAGITAQTPDPQGGKIDRDEKGEPTGILRETAMGLVQSKIPPPSPPQRRKALELAIDDAIRSGITSVQDFSTWDDFLVYEQMEKEGKLPIRIAEWLPFDLPLATLKKMRSHHSASDPMLHTSMLKAFMDGSLGSRTAAMLAPYSDDPKNSGIPRYEQDKLNKMAIERSKAGFQLGFHAIGDRAVRMALDAFAAAEKNSHKRDFRFRVEHAQVVAPEDFIKFKQLGVIASMQPNHLLTDMNWAEAHLGPERAANSYAWKKFLDEGVPLAFGTDYPVEPITPFRGVYCAVTRKNEAGTKEYFPDQKLNIHQALAAYTTGAAYAEFAENEKGVLDRGMLADFVVLDRDITKVAPPEILKTKVLRTVLGGKTVYESK